jgi:phage shock protein C
VCGGIAEYLDVDPTVVRLLTAAAALLSGVVFVGFVYLLAAMIMP